MPPTAPYQRVAAILRDRIATGHYQPGDRLPSQADLAHELGVSLAEARRGMAVLRHAGELDGSPRARLTVAHPPAVRTLIDVDADWTGPTGDGGGIGSRAAGPDIARRLATKPTARVRWQLLECLDPDLRPSHLITTWWTGSRPTTWAGFGAEASLHQLTPTEASTLGLAAGVPAWLVQRTRYDQAGHPVETADLVLPADRWRVRLR